MEKALEILKYIRNNDYIMDFLDKASIKEAIKELEEAMKPKTCSLCIFLDTARPRSHPNYAECNNRKCPLSYMEVHYEFGCKMFVPKDNAWVSNKIMTSLTYYLDYSSLRHL